MVEKIDDLFKKKYYFRERMLNDNALKINQQ